MITFGRKDGVVTFAMSEHDYGRLLMALGFAAMAALQAGGRRELYDVIRVVNELNAGNPRFTPYEVPDEEPAVEN